jgi:hypothetical protein
MLLADHLRETTRAHPDRQRSVRVNLSINRAIRLRVIKEGLSNMSRHVDHSRILVRGSAGKISMFVISFETG